MRTSQAQTTAQTNAAQKLHHTDRWTTAGHHGWTPRLDTARPDTWEKSPRGSLQERLFCSDFGKRQGVREEHSEVRLPDTKELCIDLEPASAWSSEAQQGREAEVPVGPSK